MSNTILFAIGGSLFALTTWASLVIGYLRFQHMEEPDSAEETVETLDVIETAAARPSPNGYDEPQLRVVGDRR